MVKRREHGDIDGSSTEDAKGTQGTRDLDDGSSCQ